MSQFQVTDAVSKLNGAGSRMIITVTVFY